MRSFALLTEYIAPKSLFLSVNRSPIRCGFLAGVKTTRYSLPQFLLINPRPYVLNHTLTVVQGGIEETPPLSFAMLQYFEKILPSVESLWSSWQGEVYFMGVDAAGGPWRYQTWSPSWILPRIRIQVKTARIEIFLYLTGKITHK